MSADGKQPSGYGGSPPWSEWRRWVAPPQEEITCGWIPADEDVSWTGWTFYASEAWLPHNEAISPPRMLEPEKEPKEEDPEEDSVEDSEEDTEDPEEDPKEDPVEDSQEDLEEHPEEEPKEEDPLENPGEDPEDNPGEVPDEQEEVLEDGESIEADEEVPDMVGAFMDDLDHEDVVPDEFDSNYKGDSG